MGKLIIMDQSPLTPTRLAKIGEVSVPFAWQVLNGKKPWPRKLAIKVFNETGERFGPIVGATPAEIAVLEKYEAAA